MMDSRLRAEKALREAWAVERAKAEAPRERFVITFASGWLGCAQVMLAVGHREAMLEDVEWSHAGRSHSVEFTCTWAVLKSLQTEAKGSQVSHLRCTRR